MDDMGVPVEGIIRGEHSTAPVHRVGAAVAPVHLPTAVRSRGEQPRELLQLGCAFQWFGAAHCRQC